MIGARSPVAVPAAPANVGVVSVVLLPSAGLVSVTAGGVTSTGPSTPSVTELGP